MPAFRVYCLAHRHAPDPPGQYDHAVVAGADVITRFVLSGFQSFQAVSSSVCKTDAARDGINWAKGRHHYSYIG